MAAAATAAAAAEVAEVEATEGEAVVASEVNAKGATKHLKVEH